MKKLFIVSTIITVVFTLHLLPFALSCCQHTQKPPLPIQTNRLSPLVKNLFIVSTIITVVFTLHLPPLALPHCQHTQQPCRHFQLHQSGSMKQEHWCLKFGSARSIFNRMSYFCINYCCITDATIVAWVLSFRRAFGVCQHCNNLHQMTMKNVAWRRPWWEGRKPTQHRSMPSVTPSAAIADW